MNYRMIAYILSRVLLIMAGLLLLPLITALVYGESALPFVVTVVLTALSGGALLLIRPRTTEIYAREGFVCVGLSWAAMSLLGSLPFVISGDIPRFVDALFETVSGFTTTGASILNDIESLSRSGLFWRSFTHWIGGMGVLVLMVALMPNLSGRTIHILRAEMPGPTMGKLSPRLRDTAKILYLLYIVMTAVELLLLVVGGMPLFDSAIHTFGTAGTGGFGIKAASLANYTPYQQWVIAIFMMLFGINFNLYYLLVMRRFRSALRS